MPEETRSFLLNGLPRLTPLSLRNARFETFAQFVWFLDACPALQSLEIYTSSIHEPIAVRLWPNNTHLRKLHLGSQDEGDVVVDTLFYWLQNSPKVWPLESLDIGPLGKQEMVNAWRFVQTLKPFLNHLVVSLKQFKERM